MVALAAFGHTRDAQPCRLLRISEYRLGRSAVEWQVTATRDTVYESEGWGLNSLRAR